jgi:hypothetical protein
VNELEKVFHDSVSRRAFLTRMSAAGLGGAAMALLAGCGTGGGSKPLSSGSLFDPTNFPGIPGRSADEVVLNYALTLEILEADLYRQALNIAAGLPRGNALRSGLPTGATGLNGYVQSVGNGSLSAQAAAAGFLYLVQYAYVEAAHRDFLQTALASFGAPTVVPNPGGYTADFGNTLSSILEVIYQVEEVGVRAYLGAAGFMNDPQLLTTAVAIHSTEARHSGAVAYVLGRPAGPLFLAGLDKNPINQQATPNPDPYAENTFQYYVDPPAVLSAVRPFIVS